MTAVDKPAGPGGTMNPPGVTENPLGPAAAARLRFPGPRSGRQRAFPIGALAAKIHRFAATTQRPSALRRAVAAADPIAVRQHTSAAEAIAPPKWWSPEDVPQVSLQTASALPPRGLPRAVRRVPNEQTYTPGGISRSLVPAEVRVRRVAETAAVGTSVRDSKINAAAAHVIVAKEAHEAQRKHDADVARRAPAAAATPAAAPAPPNATTPARAMSNPATAAPSAVPVTSPAPAAPPAQPARHATKTPVRRSTSKSAQAAPPSTPASTTSSTAAPPSGSALSVPAAPGGTDAPPPAGPAAPEPSNAPTPSSFSPSPSVEQQLETGAIARELAVDHIQQAWRPTPTSARFAAVSGAIDGPAAQSALRRTVATGLPTALGFGGAARPRRTRTTRHPDEHGRAGDTAAPHGRSAARLLPRNAGSLGRDASRSRRSGDAVGRQRAWR